MFMLKLLLLLVIFTAVKCDIEDKSSCFNAFRVPREGFKMKNCIPGHYEGSCLLLFSEPAEFGEALAYCHFGYGGRLATADSEDVFKKWTRRIYRDPDFQVNNDTRFWIGYGETNSVAHTFSDMKPEEVVEPFFQMTYWNKSFEGKTFITNLPWEEEPDFEKLDNFPCGDYATVFNPNNGKFDIRENEEKHPFLCETPRYPKFKCSSGWHLYPNDRLCIWFESTKRNFRGAYLGCQSMNAFPLVTEGGDDATAVHAPVIAVFALHNHGLDTDLIWSGLKRAEHEILSLDGSPVDYNARGDLQNSCNAFTGQGY